MTLPYSVRCTYVIVNIFFDNYFISPFVPSIMGGQQSVPREPNPALGPLPGTTAFGRATSFSSQGSFADNSPWAGGTSPPQVGDIYIVYILEQIFFSLSHYCLLFPNTYLACRSWPWRCATLLSDICMFEDAPPPLNTLIMRASSKVN